MISTQIFRRHFLISASVVILFILLGFLISSSLLRIVEGRPNVLPWSGPNLLFAHLIETDPSKDRIAALHRIAAAGQGQIPFKLVILDQNGKGISESVNLPVDWSTLDKPAQPFEFRSVPSDQPTHFGIPEAGITRLPGNPPEYLYTSQFGELKGPGPAGAGRPPISFVLITIGSLLVSVLGGIGFALFLVLRSITEKAEIADQVIAELQRGNLKARFPIDKMDEIGQAMTRFNRMADEIERLVETLRNLESSRVSLFQEITHDLRTPIASLKNLLATIEKKSKDTDADLRAELLDLAKNEVDYFERLIEDLLVLAQLSEPRYQPRREAVMIRDLVESEVEQVVAHGPQSVNGEVKKVEIVGASDIEISGDSHLLRRLARNGLENAFSFAKSKVVVQLDTSKPDEVIIRIQDDGPGFPVAKLATFGERKFSRIVENHKGNRVSLGLGSVIMKSVTTIHGGRIYARNQLSPEGLILGGEVVIVFPKVQRS